MSAEPAASACGDETCQACGEEPSSYAIENRPGLSAIAYRIGAHGDFKRRMLGKLSSSGSPLSGLTTRDDADFSVALLDAWAAVGDVLTFYQERIANEAFLRTATERLSVTELARLIDYRLKPGVAATTQLAFTLETAPHALGQSFSIGTTAQASNEPLPPIVIEAGTKVQSVPGPGEQAQTFETVEPVAARPEWNAMRPRRRAPQPVSVAMNSVLVQGAASFIAQGDWILIQESASERQARRVVRVSVDNDAGTTLLELAPSGATVQPSSTATRADGAIASYRFESQLDERLARRITSERWRAEDLAALLRIKGWRESHLRDFARSQTSGIAPQIGVLALRQRLGVFGCNAPAHDSLLNSKGEPRYELDWDAGSGFPIWNSPVTNANYSDNGPDLYLERSAPAIVPGSQVALLRPGAAADVFDVASAVDTAITGFGMSSRCTGLQLEGLTQARKSADYKVRNTTVLAQSELLPLADLPLTQAVAGDQIELDALYLGLSPGQRVIVSGKRSDLPGVLASEALELYDVLVDGGLTLLHLSRALAYSYERASVTVNANVALATHGETVQEVLGSGDAAQSSQTFTLRQPPLTYVQASTASGTRSTLEVRVNEVLWREVRALDDHDGDERVYVTMQDHAGNISVVFGDGASGARPATGQQNIEAKYRRGLGLAGLLQADQLTQLLTRPFGVKGVTNPLPPAGGDDPEPLAEARRNAPLKVLTLDRIVSLEDYASFTAAFGGIAKALATWSWYGQRRGVFLTVAGADGALVSEGGDLEQHLRQAIHEAGDPSVPVVVRSYEAIFFRLTAALQRDPSYTAEDVRERVERELRGRYGFAARSLGQPLHRSEIIGVIQNVRGVLAVTLSELYRSDAAPERASHLLARAPQDGDATPQAAELLTLDPRPLNLEISP